MLKYPDIKSYSGKGVDNSGLNIRFSTSASGLFATITSTDRTTQFIDVLDKKDKYYMVVDKKSIGKNSFQCLTTDPGLQSLEIRAAENADDGKLRKYRLALCTTGEFSAHCWMVPRPPMQREKPLRAGNGTASTIAKSGTRRNTEEFSIYPNPVSHTLNLDFGILTPTGKVHIYNMLGKISLVKNSTHSSTQIDISQLPGGNYILQYSDGSVHRTSKFIKL